MRVCSIEGCESRHYAKNFCEIHYARMKRLGSASAKVRTFTDRKKALGFIENLFFEDKSECITWPFRLCKGYAKLGNKEVGRIICERLYGSPKQKVHAAHSCGKGHEGCVNPKHLRWATPTENAHDKNIHGTHNRGSRHGMSKLTEEKVNQIRELIREGKTQHKDIAKMFGVSKTTICNINKNKAWL